MIVVDANGREVAAIALLSFHYDFKKHIIVDETTIMAAMAATSLTLASTTITPVLHYKLTSINVKSDQLILFDVK